jgi:transposase
MLHLSATTKYYFCGKVVDMRKGIMGLCGVVHNEIKQDLLARGVFVFMNRSKTTIKMLQWDGDGFALYEKKLLRGTFEQHCTANDNAAVAITYLQMQHILQGVVLHSVRMRKRYVKI